MLRHLSRKQLNDYLDNALPSAESRAIWEHLQGCPVCRNQLRQEDYLRRDLQHEFAAVRTPDHLRNLLPGILAEAGEPDAMPMNRNVAVLVTLLVVVMLLPMFPSFDLTTIDANPHMLNVPLPTDTPSQDQQTREWATQEQTSLATPEAFTLQNSFDVEYASPVPPPRVTAETSPEAGGNEQ
jgi:hypothetical protein